MAARFGRNKRRAAREAVANAEARAASAAAMTNEMARQKAAAEHQAAQLCRDLDELCERLMLALGHDTGLVPIFRAQRHTLGFRASRWPVPPPAVRAYAFTAIPQDGFDIHAVDMFEVVVRLVKDPHQLRRDIRIVVERPIGGDEYVSISGAGIAFSLDHFRRHGVTSRDVDWLFHEHREQLKAFISGADGLRKGTRYVR